MSINLKLKNIMIPKNSKQLFFGFITTMCITIIFCCDKSDKENKVPSCEIICPSNGQEITKGEIMHISVEAVDNDGNIVEIEYFIDSLKVDSSISFPYYLNWNSSDELLGNHTIIATAIDNNGALSSDTVTILLTKDNRNINKPIAAFTVDKTYFPHGTSVQFTDESLNTPIYWRWEFGDGDTSHLQNPSHTYSFIGNYNVTLTVINCYGSDTKVISNYVTAHMGEEIGTITDYDGNTYNTIKYGEQWWMAENLKTTHYADGTEITLVESENIWRYQNQEEKAYCYNNNNINNEAQIYGALYTWAATVNGFNGSSSNPSNIQGICPSEWHVPSDDEWKQLEMYLGMSQLDADKDKDHRGTNEGSKLAGNASLWKDGALKNDTLFEISGFMAVPAGFNESIGGYGGLGDVAIFWCTDMISNDYDSFGYLRMINYDNTKVRRSQSKVKYGYSVRCIKD